MRPTPHPLDMSIYRTHLGRRTVIYKIVIHNLAEGVVDRNDTDFTCTVRNMRPVRPASCFGVGLCSYDFGLVSLAD